MLFKLKSPRLKSIFLDVLYVLPCICTLVDKGQVVQFVPKCFVHARFRQIFLTANVNTQRVTLKAQKKTPLFRKREEYCIGFIGVFHSISTK